MAHNARSDSEAAAGSSSTPPPLLHKERHIKYHLRCLKTVLPTAYTSYDANRMMIGFFNLASLDLLGALDSSITPAERAGFVEWIYGCQHPYGGFRAFPGTDFGAERLDSRNQAWDPANVPGTLFALLNLLLLGDDLLRVGTSQTLRWLSRLQLHDGSFGEMLGSSGRSVGGSDLRYAYMATCIRHILSSPYHHDIPDIDVERLAQFVLNSQTYDGGFGEKALHESHAGYSLLGVSTLSLLDKLPLLHQQAESQVRSPDGYHHLIKWLVSRQIPTPNLDEESDNEAEPDAEASTSGFDLASVFPAAEMEPAGPLQADLQENWSAGFNGRCNKPEDTCYSFWVVGCLDVLNKADLIDSEANRRFLLDRTQHLVGGFSKFPEQLPDVLHSFFGLAALSITHDPALKPLATALSISVDCKDRIDNLSWKRYNKV